MWAGVPSAAGGRIGGDRHVGSEQFQQPGEVTFACGGHEGVHDLPVGEGSSGAAGRTLARAREASLRAATVVVSSIEAMTSKSTPKLSCSTKVHRSRGQPVEHHLQRDADGVGQHYVVGGIRFGLRRPRSTPSGSGVRARSRSRHSREVTGVSQPGKLSIGSSVA